MLLIILGITVSYLIGSIPTAYIFGRLLKGIDIRKFGSGNVGATNAFRVLGKGYGIVVLVLDIFKGLFAVVLLGDILVSKNVFISSQLLFAIIGLSCVLGHNWTVFLRFKGGKGMATSLGVLLGLSIKIPGLKLILGLSILTWIVIFVISRIVSLSSILASVSMPMYLVLFKQSKALIFLSSLLCAFILLRHKANLKRLIQRKEPRLF